MKIEDIAIKDIHIRENIRQQGFDNIAELMQSIKDYGLMQPIGVKKEDDYYELIWGSRRLQASKKLGWKSIPAVIFIESEQELSEEEFFILNATENLQRRQNTLLEFGRVCKILRKTLSTSEIATRLGVSKSRVENALIEIQRIPKKWQGRIRIMEGEKEKKGDIPLGVASSVARLRGLDETHKDKLLEHISKNDASAFEIVNLASLMKSGKTFEEAKKAIKDYRPMGFKVLVHNDKYEKYKEEKGYKSDNELITEAINNLVGKGVCIKIVSQAQYPQRVSEILKRLEELEKKDKEKKDK
jgi:ParB/RepB/Spo0J family partition protein